MDKMSLWFFSPKICLSVFSFHCRYASAAVMVITSVLHTPRPKSLTRKTGYCLFFCPSNSSPFSLPDPTTSTHGPHISLSKKALLPTTPAAALHPLICRSRLTFIIFRYFLPNRLHLLPIFPTHTLPNSTSECTDSFDHPATNRTDRTHHITFSQFSDTVSETGCDVR